MDAELHDYLSRVDYVVLGAGNRRGRAGFGVKHFLDKLDIDRQM
ncbi:hypothetical protein [Enterocloster clostridioformis]|nr:hypothetical protein [Enterocloster clostridioformis]